MDSFRANPVCDHVKQIVKPICNDINNLHREFMTLRDAENMQNTYQINGENAQGHFLVFDVWASQDSSAVQ
jgi:hypothetical protein